MKSVKCYYINQEPRLELAPHIWLAGPWINFMNFFFHGKKVHCKPWTPSQCFSTDPTDSRMCGFCSVLSSHPLFCPLLLLVAAGLKNVNFLLRCILFVLMRLSEHLSLPAFTTPTTSHLLYSWHNLELYLIHHRPFSLTGPWTFLSKILNSHSSPLVSIQHSLPYGCEQRSHIHFICSSLH
jgi:hypothetical protein